MNGILYFVADDGQHGFELWRSDGTPEGTWMVADINPTGSAFEKNQALESFDGMLYFPADDGVHGKELWRSDGEEEGTALVKDINPAGDSNPSGLTMTANNILMFAADDGSHGVELWKVAGDGAEMVKDINPEGSSAPRRLTAYGDLVLFAARDCNPHGVELWKSDGSEAGTAMIADIHPSGDGDPRSFLLFNGKVYFIATDGSSETFDGSELFEMWETDGSGITKITDHIPFMGISERGISYDLFPGAGRIFFWSTINQYMRILWRSDGAPEGTEAFQYTQQFWFHGGYMPCGDRIYFVQRTELNNWLRAFDSGVSDFVDIDSPPDDYDPDIRLLYCHNDALYLEMNGFWKTDASGICAVTAAHDNFFEIDGELYSIGASLWKFDATGCGAVEVGPIHPSAASNPASHVLVMDGAAYFTADDGSSGAELWMFDPEPEVLLVAGASSRALRVYPMPASDYLIMESADYGPGRVLVWDMTGWKVMEVPAAAADSWIRLDVATLPPGAYILEIRFELKTVYGKFIK